MYSINKLLPVVIIFTSAICINSCKPKVKEILTAEFSLSKKFINVGDTVRFKNDSKNFKKLFWDFGDGSTSEGANPVHAYSKGGTFYPKITVYSGSETKESKLKITVAASNVSIVVPDTIVIGKEVTFKTTGSGKFNWKINTEVVAQNSESVRHSFLKEGSYKVEIINPTTASSVDMKDISVLSLPAVKEPPGKTASIIISSLAFYTDDLINYSTKATDPVQWDLGGKSTSENTSGQISFSDAGKYVIKLMDKASGKVLDTRTISIIEKVDDSKFSAWLMDLANNKLSRTEKTARSILVYSYCLNNGEIPIGGEETGSFKDFVRKIMIESNPYEAVDISVNLQFNANKKISSVQLVTYRKRAI
jgi:PKD repeat protein